MNRSTKKSRLVVAISLMFTIPTAIMLAALTGTIMYLVNKSILESQIELTTELASARAAEMSEWMGSFLSEMRIFSIQDEVLNGDETAIRKYILERGTKKHDAVEYVLFSDLNGRTFNSLGLTSQVSDREYFKAIVDDGKPFFRGKRGNIEGDGTCGGARGCPGEG